MYARRISPEPTTLQRRAFEKRVAEMTRMDPLTLAFDDAALEREYRAARRLRWDAFAIGTGLLSAVWIAYMAWAAVIAPEDRGAVATVVLALLPLCAASIAITGVVPKPRRQAAMAIAGPANAFAGGLALVAIHVLGGPLLSRYASAGIATLLLIIHTFVNGRFVRKQTVSLALIAIWVVASAIAKPITRDAVVDTLFFVALGEGVGSWVSWRQERQSRRIFLQRRIIEDERAKSESLLRNILPEPIVERLKKDTGRIADGFDSVTVLFADLVGFTPMSQKMTPTAVVALLDEIYSAFDELARKHGLEKIKTIGDAYMVAGGVPVAREGHAPAMARMALDMLDAIGEVGGGALSLRIGIHTGPAVAGVIGLSKFGYDLWGDTVNTASRMESHGEPGEIHVTDAARAAIGDGFTFRDRGTIDVKGKGPMHTWWLTGRA